MTDSERLGAAFTATLALPPDVDLTRVAYGRTETWDSVAHLQLVLAIEEAFEITLDPDDVVEMSSFAAATRILRDRHGIAVG